MLTRRKFQRAWIQAMWTSDFTTRWVLQISQFRARQASPALILEEVPRLRSTATEMEISPQEVSRTHRTNWNRGGKLISDPRMRLTLSLCGPEQTAVKNAYEMGTFLFQQLHSA